MSSSGGTERRKRIRVDCERAQSVVRALASAQGFAVVDEKEPADLAIVEVRGPEDLLAKRDPSPVVAVSRRRLRELELRAFKEAGARAVIDADSSVLDLAFAISELTFCTCASMRRYGRAFGGVPVRFRSLLGDHTGGGRLFGIARSGSFIAADQRVAEGTPVEIELDLCGRIVVLRGRVAFVEEQEAREGATSARSSDRAHSSDRAQSSDRAPWAGASFMAIEFALDDGDVAPKLFSTFEEAGSEPRSVTRAPRVRHASGSR